MESRSLLEFSALSTVLLAHDLQNLLSIMARCADSLSHRAHVDLADRDFAELNEAIDAGFRLSRDILAAVGLQEAVEPPIIDVHELIARYHGTLQRLAGPNVRLVVDAEPPPTAVQAAPVHLEWILLNLLANARDAMPSGGVVHLQTARVERRGGSPHAPIRGDRYLQLTVRDEGASDDEIETAAFEPFFTTKEGRVGLGLTSVAATVRALKGWLYLERHDAGGTSVHVFLPLFPQTPQVSDHGGTPA